MDNIISFSFIDRALERYGDKAAPRLQCKVHTPSWPPEAFQDKETHVRANCLRNLPSSQHTGGQSETTLLTVAKKERGRMTRTAKYLEMCNVSLSIANICTVDNSFKPEVVRGVWKVTYKNCSSPLGTPSSTRTEGVYVTATTSHNKGVKLGSTGAFRGNGSTGAFRGNGGQCILLGAPETCRTVIAWGTRLSLLKTCRQ